ncbi:MAG: FG-GAP-like repeat-containing protein [Nitrospirota bacterium]|nr:FG-GAP-like repeat-containing protein [Nitrospirota bacterium]
MAAAVLAGLCLLLVSSAHAQTVPAASAQMAVATFNPIPLTFGFRPLGSPPDPRPPLVQVTNIGSVDLVLASITSTHADFFADVSQLLPIQPGGTWNIPIRFEPSAEGDVSADLIFVSNDPFNPEFRLPVSGTGINVQVTIAPPSAVMLTGESLQFVPTVSGTPVQELIWSATGPGTVTSSGLYSAPTGPGVTVVKATSVVDPTKSASVTITTLAGDITIPPGSFPGAGRFGSRVITADLDNDGFREVIASAPLADVSVAGVPVAAAGQVWIREFGWDGFSALPVLLSSPSPVANGQFGTSLAAADVNGDGLTDLVIGEPGGVGAVPGAGVVHAFLSQPNGTFSAPISLSLPSGVAGDRFGATLATGYFAGATVQAVAAGAPGRTVAGLPLAGEVHVLSYAGTPGIVLAAPLTQPVPQAGAAFGESLTRACLDGCSQYGLSGEAAQVNDLLVGAPGAAVTAGGVTYTSAGQVFAFHADVASPTPRFRTPIELHSPFPASGARFGHEIAAGDLSGDLLQDVAVSALGQPVIGAGGVPVAAGAVFLFFGDGLEGLHWTNQLLPPSPSDGLRFGATLRINDVDGDGNNDLGVGTASLLQNGSVTVYLGNGNTGFGRMRLFGASGQTPGDGYGAAFAIADLNLDGHRDIICGAPYAGTDAGGVFVVLQKPFPAISVTPGEASLAVTGKVGRQEMFSGSVAQEKAVWDVVGAGTITTPYGLYSAPAGLALPIQSAPMVRLKDPDNAGYWALGQVRLVQGMSVLTSPDLALDASGSQIIGLGYPTPGVNFGASVGVSLIGRDPLDPDRNKPSVIGSYPTQDTAVAVRLDAFPYTSDPATPFPSIIPYTNRQIDPISGQLVDAGSTWGTQLVGGDFDGDGLGDVAVSAPYAKVPGSNDPQVGFVDVWLLDANGGIRAVNRIVPEITMTAPNGLPLWNVNNTRANTRYGFRLAARDLNGDGRDDLIVGAPYGDVGGVVNAGFVEVLLAPANGDWLFSGPLRAVVTELAPRSNAFFGSALALGDVTGDGIAELFVGAPGRDPKGTPTDNPATPRVVGIAPTNWQVATSSALRIATLGTARMVVTDPIASPFGHPSGFGMGLAVGNLITSDPADELVVGAPFRTRADPFFYDPAKPGAFDREVGEALLYDTGPGFTALPPLRIGPPGVQQGMEFGVRLAVGHFAPGGTGAASLVVSAPYHDSPVGPDTGSIFFYRGQTSGPPVSEGYITAYAGSAHASFGDTLIATDLNLDGQDELIATSPTTDVSLFLGYMVYPGRFQAPEAIIEVRRQAGKVYVIFPGHM